MQYTVDSKQFDLAWAVLMNFFSQTGVALLVYGIYAIFFLLSIYTLSPRRKTPGIKFLIAASCVMAVLGTTQIAATIAVTLVDARFVQQIVYGQVSSQENSQSILKALETIQNVTFAINNFVTDCFFLYRCYVIWGFKKKILIPPVLLMLSTFAVAVLGCVSRTPVCGGSTEIRITFALGTATNLVLTALTAGRILWIRRAASHVGLDALRSRYNTAIAIILESGAIYCVMAIFMVISFSLENARLYFIGLGIAEQLINIIPTFTLVYIGLKNTIGGIGQAPFNSGIPTLSSGY
ncbi:hypothetical protein B0H13DRAFT_935847 [Mycena leptocephala]|nr:hypothetical protein B0H13DRAFT_935847 [Mycena leptocephala]